MNLSHCFLAMYAGGGLITNEARLRPLVEFAANEPQSLQPTTWASRLNPSAGCGLTSEVDLEPRCARRSRANDVGFPPESVCRMWVDFRGRSRAALCEALTSHQRLPSTGPAGHHHDHRPRPPNVNTPAGVRRRPAPAINRPRRPPPRPSAASAKRQHTGRRAPPASATAHDEIVAARRVWLPMGHPSPSVSWPGSGAGYGT